MWDFLGLKLSFSWGEAELSVTGLQRGRCSVRAVVLCFGIRNVLCLMQKTKKNS